MNPRHSPNKNLFFAILFIVSFIIIWDKFVVSRYAPPSVKPPTRQKQPAAHKNDQTITDVPPGPAPVDGRLAGPDKTVSIESNDTRVTIGSRGGRVLSWEVKEDDHWVELVSPGGKTKPSRPLETFPDQQFVLRKRSANEVEMSLSHPYGIVIKKTLTLSDAAGFQTVEIKATNRTLQTREIETELQWGPGLYKKIQNEEEKNIPVTHTAEMRAVAFSNNLKKWKPGLIFGRSVDKQSDGPFEWAGVDNNYFLAAFIPTQDPFSSIHVQADKKTAPTISIPIYFQLDPGQSATRSFKLYVGPKSLDRLTAVDPSLKAAINFGIFGPISKFLLVCLDFFERFTGNYGWAIIILTICYQVLVFPLTKKSLQHSVKMRELQPQIKKIQAQFKSDPKRLQMETLNLYRKNGMKFMGMEGCLPMLVQIPFFFSIYRALQMSYTLRGAPWILWIQNLAAPDPYYVLPILMGGSTLLQQKVTSVTVDPAQAKMMLIMPIFLVFVFLKMPSGLVLYWCVQSVTTIGVQKYLQWRKFHLPPPVSA